MTGLFGDDEPRKELLDEIVPDRPVLVQEFSEHVSWVNSRMLELMEIDSSFPDHSELAVYVRDENGEPTGCVKEGAWFYDIDRMFENMGWYPPDALCKENMKSMYDSFKAYGHTSVVNALLEGEEELKSAYELDQEGLLQLHYEASLRWDDLKTLDEGIALAKEYQKKYTSENVKLKTMKIFIDGTMSTGNVGLVDPMSNDPDSTDWARRHLQHPNSLNILQSAMQRDWMYTYILQETGLSEAYAMRQRSAENSWEMTGR